MEAREKPGTSREETIFSARMQRAAEDYRLGFL
jgi:hypothetical protein